MKLMETQSSKLKSLLVSLMTQPYHWMILEVTVEEGHLFYDPSLPLAVRCTSESSTTITMIIDSSTFGEAITPQFQFPSKARAENMRLNLDIVRKMKSICGVPKLLPCTSRINEKGG